ncbi:MAG TPA: RDD family protein, partial [Pyrinomonadaceae bacterium]
SGRGQAATAAARVVEERPVQEAPEPAAPPPPPPLVVVQPKQPAKVEQPQVAVAEPAAAGTHAEETRAVARTSAAQTSATREAEATAEPVKKSEVSQATPQTRAAAQAQPQPASKQPRHISGVLDEFWLERQGIELLPKVEEKELTYDDRAPRVKRVAAALVDLFAVALLCAPFAVAIHLTIGNWGDTRVSGSMGLIAALVMFLYHTCSVALAGRTPGMSMLALHAVDARKACVPTTGQCMRRAAAYILSLASGGLGLLYSLFDAEGRTVHDILSGTVVVRK